MKRVVVAGGSGGIGRTLIKYFRNQLGDKLDLTVISRSSNLTIPGVNRVITWDEVENQGLPSSDAVVSVVGSNIMDHRWTEDRKRELRNSRIEITKLLVEKMQTNQPKAFVSASATGIYPVDTDQEFDEFSQIPNNPDMPFPQKLCVDWEEVVFEAKQKLPNTHVSVIRVSVVLGPQQNAIKSMIWPFKLGLGGPIGSGQQYFPWIHEEDLAKQFYQAAIHPETSPEIINGVAPEVITQSQFARAFAGALNRPAFMPMPGFVLRLIFQERADLLLSGAKIAPRAFQNFEYSFPDVQSACSDIVQNL